MNAEFEIPNDPKFEVTVRQMLYNLMQAFTIGDDDAVGRILDSMKAFLAPWFEWRAKGELAKIKINLIEMKSLYTDRDKENIIRYGELEDDRLEDIMKEMKRINDAERRKARLAELTVLMKVANEMNLGFGKDVEIFDDGSYEEVQPNPGEDKSKNK